ncbi:hypothetical protein QTP88_009116 [Uroleucon formosanum]
MSKFFELFNIKKKPNETAKSENVLPTEIPEKSTDSSSNIDFDFQIQISDINDLGNINSGPSRPIMKSYPMTKFGQQNRSFNASYYDYFEWLEYSIINDALYCFACRIYGSGNNSEDTFNKIRNKRNRKEPNDLNNFIVTARTSAQYTELTESNVQTTKDFYRINAYYVILDTPVTKLKERFSNDSLQMGISVDNFFQLKFEESQFFIDHYQVNLQFLVL